MSYNMDVRIVFYKNINLFKMIYDTIQVYAKGIDGTYTSTY